MAAEASLPLGWRLSGLWRFDDLWIALSEGPAFDDYLSGSASTRSRRCAGWRTGYASGEGLPPARSAVRFRLKAMAEASTRC